ncbi:MAG: hypothetical protein CMJ89_11540 [Planctomycetes bacterium]|nr:hypothetical protein [Planctomycetota bacterium]
MNGPKPVVVYGPAFYQSMFEIDLFANDVAILEATAAEEDTIVVVNGSGITLLSGYDAGNYDVQEISLANAPSWPGATRVKVGDVTRDGFEDLVGLSASGDLLILESVRSETPVETVIPMTAQVFDFVVVDWDGAFENHLAVLRTDGIHVCDLAGTLIFSIPVTVGPPIDGGSLAIFRENDFAFDRLAVLYEYTGLHDLLPVDSGPTDPDEAQLDLFTFDFFAMAVADADLDGRDDLYLVNRSTHQSLLLLNQGDVPGEPTFEVDPLVGNYEIVDLCSNGMGPGQCPLEDGSGTPLVGHATNGRPSDCACLREWPFSTTPSAAISRFEYWEPGHRTDFGAPPNLLPARAREAAARPPLAGHPGDTAMAHSSMLRVFASDPIAVVLAASPALSRNCGPQQAITQDAPWAQGTSYDRKRCSSRR